MIKPGVCADDLFLEKPLIQSFFCFRWSQNDERPAFFVESTISGSREECWDKILKSWPVPSGPNGRKRIKRKINAQGGCVVAVNVIEVFEKKSTRGGSYEER